MFVSIYFQYKNGGGDLMNQFTTTKRMLVAVILAVAMIFSVSTIATAEVEERAHGELAYQYLEFIDENLPERIAFSPRERETAEWIVYELIKMGHSPDNIYIQEFPAPEHITMWGVFGLGPEDLLGYSQNVILTVPGISDKTIIVGAHYDGVDNNGISDNASGTVVLLESAQRMLYLDHYYTIVYIFFGAEEVGLIGAYYYVDSLTAEEKENIVLMINIDVIFDGSVLFYAAGFHDIETSEMGSNAATLLIDEIAQNLNAELDLGLVSQHNGIYLPSDQLPFVWAGFNVVVFYAVDNFEPMAPGSGMSILDRVLLIEAMVHGTDDPELIKAIYEQRMSLEWTLWWYLDDAEGLPERIENIEQQMKEEDNRMVIGWLQEEMEAISRIIVLLEHPDMEKFEFTYPRPLSALEEISLIEAMVFGTDDPELIAKIYENRENLEWTLAWRAHTEMEWLLEDIERMEQWLKEEEDPRNIEWIQESLEITKRIIAVLESPQMEEFVFEYATNFGPTSILEEVLLIEAMVYGTDDPELIARIYENRENLEWTLAFVVYMGEEGLLEYIEMAEQYIREEEDPVLIEMWLENLEALQKLMAILESSQMEEFVFEYEFDFDNWWSPGFGYVLHTPNDNLTFINENWPGLIERALNSYLIFLENILTLPAQSLELVN